MHTPLTITEVPSIGTLTYSATQVSTATLAGNKMNSCRPLRSRILCFSYDRILGETRRAVLQRRYDAVFVSSLHEVTDLISAPPFDAIVLCHTVPFDERQGCIAFAGRVWPMAKIILVASGNELLQPGIDRAVLGLAGPEKLLHAVQQVLRPTVSLADLH